MGVEWDSVPSLAIQRVLRLDEGSTVSGRWEAGEYWFRESS